MKTSTFFGMFLEKCYRNASKTFSQTSTLVFIRFGVEWSRYNMDMCFVKFEYSNIINISGHEY